jgi:hypothetical protein
MTTYLSWTTSALTSSWSVVNTYWAALVPWLPLTAAPPVAPSGTKWYAQLNLQKSLINKSNYVRQNSYAYHSIFCHLPKSGIIFSHMIVKTSRLRATHWYMCKHGQPMPRLQQRHSRVGLSYICTSMDTTNTNNILSITCINSHNMWSNVNHLHSPFISKGKECRLWIASANAGYKLCMSLASSHAMRALSVPTHAVVVGALALSSNSSTRTEVDT